MASDDSNTLSLTETEAGFILHVTNSDRTITHVALTPEQLVTISQSANVIRERAISKLLPSGSRATAIASTPVEGVGLNYEALGEDILLTLVAVNGGHQTFSLSPQKAGDLADKLYNWLRQLPEARSSTKTKN